MAVLGTTYTVTALAYDSSGDLFAPTTLAWAYGIVNQGQRDAFALGDFSNPATGTYTNNFTPSAAGEHWWELTITDSSGNAFVTKGTFLVSERPK